MNDRGLGEEVVGNRLEIAVAQIFETVLDGFPHRALDLALLGRGAGPQELNKVILFPLADPGARIGRDIGDELALGSVRCPGQRLPGPRGTEEIAGGVALAAVCKRGDEVSSSILRSGIGWNGPGVKNNSFQPVCRERQESGKGTSCARFCWRTAGSENRYALSAQASLSVIPVKLVYGNTGK